MPARRSHRTRLIGIAILAIVAASCTSQPVIGPRTVYVPAPMLFVSAAVAESTVQFDLASNSAEWSNPEDVTMALSWDTRPFRDVDVVISKDGSTPMAAAEFACEGVGCLGRYEITAAGVASGEGAVVAPQFNAVVARESARRAVFGITAVTPVQGAMALVSVNMQETESASVAVRDVAGEVDARNLSLRVDGEVEAGLRIIDAEGGVDVLGAGIHDLEWPPSCLTGPCGLALTLEPAGLERIPWVLIDRGPFDGTLAVETRLEQQTFVSAKDRRFGLSPSIDAPFVARYEAEVPEWLFRGFSGERPVLVQASVSVGGQTADPSVSLSPSGAAAPSTTGARAATIELGRCSRGESCVFDFDVSADPGGSGGVDGPFEVTISVSALLPGTQQHAPKVLILRRIDE